MEALSYKLSVNREPATPDLLSALQQVEFETGANGADMMRLTFAIGPKDNRSGWTLVDDDIFERLAPIRLAITVGDGPPALLAYTLVTEVSLTFSERSGESVLSVLAMDPSILINLEEKNVSWPDRSDSEIAQEIFTRSSKRYQDKFGCDFVPVVDPTSLKRHERDQKVVQSATTDMRFLKHLAERNANYVVYVATNRDTGNIEGHFHPKRLDPDPQGELRVNRGPATNVSAFNLNYNMMLPAIVQGAGIDADTQKADEPLATAERIGQTLLGSEQILEEKDPRRILARHTGLFERGELQAWVQAETDRTAQGAISATGELTTAAYGGLLVPDRPVTVTGIGPKFSGTYFIESISHTLSGDGYTQRFSLSRNALGKGR